MSHWTRWWLVTFSVGLSLDQVTKQLGGRGASRNTGVAFSWLAGAAPFPLALSLTFFVLVLILLTWRHARSGRIAATTHALWVAGAAGNLLDRWQWGGVRDIWQLPGLGIRNNLADWLIVAGIALLAVQYAYDHFGRRSRLTDFE